MSGCRLIEMRLFYFFFVRFLGLWRCSLVQLLFRSACHWGTAKRTIVFKFSSRDLTGRLGLDSNLKLVVDE